jgi:hypothetical protein
LGIYLAGVLLILWRPATDPGSYRSSCLFRNATGIPCPGCGMGRGVVHTFYMEFKKATFAHPFAIPVSLLIICIPFWIAADLISGKYTLFHSHKQIDLFFLRQRWAFWLLMVLLIALWIYNIYKFQHHNL